MPNEKNEELEVGGKLKRKEYERELARLHVEFVKLQQWVVGQGLKVCIVFEGRDGAYRSACRRVPGDAFCRSAIQV